MQAKKIVIMVLSLTSHAVVCGTIDEIQENYSSKEGVYLGAGVGGTFDRHYFTATKLADGYQTNATGRHNNILGNVFAGYGHTLNSNFYLSGEVGTYFPQRTTIIYDRPGVNLITATFNEEQSIQDYITLDALLGYRLCPSYLIYGRAGIAFSQLKLYQQPNLLTGTPSFNGSKNKQGGRFGVGMTYSFNQCWGLSLDYFYTTYSNLKILNDVFDSPAQTYQDKASSNYFGLSFVYTFKWI